MRFALLGNHSDGIDLAVALVATGRHDVVAYDRADPGLKPIARSARLVPDVEEILADPAVEAVIVAGSVDTNPALLRRALQSERHVLCVHPAGDGPEIAYETAMMRDDTHCVLLPILIEALHPAIRRLSEFVFRAKAAQEPSTIGEVLLLQIERSGIIESDSKAAFPGWDVLRALGGEIAELSAFAAAEEAGDDEPALLTGRFEQGGLFQVALLPRLNDPAYRLTVVGRHGRAELLFPVGPDGPAFLTCPDGSGTEREEYWEAWDGWPTMIEVFENAVAKRAAAVSWQDAVRAMELDDAARRSLSKRRTSLLEYPEATEEVGFKGTMTLVGCGVLWAVLLLVILTAWVPWLRWAIVPLLVVFLGMQLLRYALPKPPAK
jgi:predicted dehydrogenase